MSATREQSFAFAGEHLNSTSICEADMNELQGFRVGIRPTTNSDVPSAAITSLQSLRNFAGLTDHEMAHRLDIPVKTIHEIEAFDKITAESLKHYAIALGFELSFDNVVTVISELFITTKNLHCEYSPAVEQMNLPLLDNYLKHNTRDIVLSIHPHYSSLILSGEKTVELRRRFPATCSSRTLAYIYSTSPVQALVGMVQISAVEKLPVLVIWKEYQDKACISENDFFSYFFGAKVGYAIKLDNAQALPKPLQLLELKKRFHFEPPQSFVYVRPELLGALQDE